VRNDKCLHPNLKFCQNIFCNVFSSRRVANHKLRETNPSKIIAVFNIDYDTSEEEIEAKFKQFGKIVNVAYIRDPASKKFKGYAFITYKHLKSAQRAVDSKEKILFNKRQVTIDFSSTRGATGRLKNEVDMETGQYLRKLNETQLLTEFMSEIENFMQLFKRS
jgi:RNA recognition motif-containing protein